MSLGTFLPDQPDNTVTLTATIVPATATLPATTGEQAQIFNGGSVLVFVAVGPTAGTSGLPIPPGSTITISIGSAARSVSAVAASGSAVVHVTRGRYVAF